MKKLSNILIIVGAVAALIAGTCQLARPFIFIIGPKAWIGIAAILLLTSIAINTLPKE